MEPLPLSPEERNTKTRSAAASATGIIFIVLGLIALSGGVFFGTLAAFQFIKPEFFPWISFVRLRPLHVSLAVAWIFLISVGGIYYYVPKYSKVKLYSDKLSRIHFWIFLFTGLAILFCYLIGKFGGREYWEFPPWLSIPIFISWFLFGWNYFKTVFQKKEEWPVYLWMWATGIVFFFITFAEAHLWLIPFFSDNVIREITVQWKAYGALVGSWNMLVYGTAIFLLARIKANESIAYSKLSFAMYLLGFTNLLFGWAHHIYIVPTASWIRHVSYAMSMTELLILARIIWNWKNSLSEAIKDFHFLPYRFLVASDFWILFNLMLAILISIPAVNIYTHGTHITVAHAMGSTIGINTMILLASSFFLIMDVTKHEFTPVQKKKIRLGFWIVNISLIIFWLSLISAGIQKGILIIENKLSFREIMDKIKPELTVFAISGLGIFIGIMLLVLPAIHTALSYLKKNAI